METKGSHIGISMLSCFPQSFGPGGLMRVAESVAGLGMGLQLVPMIGFDRNDLLHLKHDVFGPDIVLTYEGAWDNDTSLKRAWEKTRRFGDLFAFVGPFVFGRGALKKVEWFKELFPNAVGIDVDPDGVIEVSPKRPMTVENYLSHSGGVCVDLLYIREDPLITTDISRLLNRLVEGNCVKAVQIQTRTHHELLEFARGDWNKLSEYLIVLAPILPKVPIIMEFLPWHLWGQSKELLPTLKKRIEDFMY